VPLEPPFIGGGVRPVFGKFGSISSVKCAWRAALILDVVMLGRRKVAAGVTHGKEDGGAASSSSYEKEEVAFN
jgi:hypothetical protein